MFLGGLVPSCIVVAFMKEFKLVHHECFINCSSSYHYEQSEQRLGLFCPLHSLGDIQGKVSKEVK